MISIVTLQMIQCVYYALTPIVLMGKLPRQSDPNLSDRYATHPSLGLLFLQVTGFVVIVSRARSKHYVCPYNHIIRYIQVPGNPSRALPKQP